MHEVAWAGSRYGVVKCKRCSLIGSVTHMSVPAKETGSAQLRRNFSIGMTAARTGVKEGFSHRCPQNSKLADKQAKDLKAYFESLPCRNTMPSHDWHYADGIIYCSRCPLFWAAGPLDVESRWGESLAEFINKQDCGKYRKPWSVPFAENSMHGWSAADRLKMLQPQ